MPTKGGGSQREGEKMDGRWSGSAKAAEAVGKIGFEDTKSWMEQRLAKLRSGTPNSGDPGGVVAVGDPGEDAIVGEDPVVNLVGEVVMGDLLGEVFAGDPVGEAIVFETMSAPASKPFNGGSAMTSAAPFAFGLSTIQTAPSTSRGTAFSFGTGAPSLFTHARLLAAPPANPPPLSATVFRFEAGSTTAAFGALAPAAFESTPAGFRSIGQPAATKPAPTTPATTFAFGASLTPAAPTTAGFGRAPLFQFGTTPQPAQFQEDIPGIRTRKANNKNEGTISTKTKEVMHPEGVEDKWRILVTHAQDDCRYIRQQIFESKFAFIMMCAAFLLMISINILVLRLMRMFQEAHRLFNMAPEDTPKESQYPLDKLNYSTLYNA
jgi:hypothetical protein